MPIGLLSGNLTSEGHELVLHIPRHLLSTSDDVWSELSRDRQFIKSSLLPPHLLQLWSDITRNAERPIGLLSGKLTSEGHELLLHIPKHLLSASDNVWSELSRDR